MNKRLLQSQVMEVSYVPMSRCTEKTQHIYKPDLHLPVKRTVYHFQKKKKLDLEIIMLARKILHVFSSYEEFK